MAGRFYPPPPVFVGGAQPYAPKKNNPVDYVSDAPPLRGAMPTAVLYTLRQLWVFPPPRGQQPEQISPSTSTTELQGGGWNAHDPQLILIGQMWWRPPQPPPQRAPKSTASEPTPDKPPLHGHIGQANLARILQNWIPGPPQSKFTIKLPQAGPMASAPTGADYHGWGVKAIGIKTKVSVKSQVDADDGDT